MALAARSLVIGCVMVLAALNARAQVQIITPLPNAVIQVHGDSSSFVFSATVNRSVSSISVAIEREDSASPRKFIPVNIAGDTARLRFVVPSVRHSFRLIWRAQVADSTVADSIDHLSPGHIIGIAGQSNAEGYCWDMHVGPFGDIRMLRYDPRWETASEPTGGTAGGPWIVMANELYARLGDSLPIGIVNVAVGGTGLIYDIGSGRWKRNPAVPDDSTTVYGNALRRFRRAGSDFEYLCWIQGEADGCCNVWEDPELYRAAFTEMVHALKADLSSDFQVLHLQIAGCSKPGAWVGSYPTAREALRELSTSVIVGTAIGRSLNSEDGLHYTVPTLMAVGKMFADAILSLQHGAPVGMYPPLLPDSSVMDSASDIPGRYCISVKWKRDGMPFTLQSVTPAQYFSLVAGFSKYDTSQVAYRIDPSDPTRVQIWLRNAQIDPLQTWWVTYVPTAGAADAPIATIHGTDTVFATAFYQIRVRSKNDSGVPLRSPLTESITVRARRLIFRPYPNEEPGTLEVFNEIGKSVSRGCFVADDVGEDVPVSGVLAPGVYFVELATTRKRETTRVIVR